MRNHGMPCALVYNSALGVDDAVNKTPSMSFNGNEAKFPPHNEYNEITKGFASMCDVCFNNICLAVDEMLIWRIQPSADCAELEMCKRLFHSFRRAKVGMALMAGYNHL